MTANGGRPRQKTNNCPMAGAGAGGSIWLEAPTITGRSTVQANGEQGDSAGGSCMGGSGSGGRIALWVDTGKLGRSINAIAQGGSYSYSTGGAAGTVYINDGGRGLLRIDNGGITNHEAYTPWPPARCTSTTEVAVYCALITVASPTMKPTHPGRRLCTTNSIGLCCSTLAA